jgi:adenylate cyclase
MEGNVQRLLRLMNQLLDFSRIESGGMEVAYKKVQLIELVQPIVDAFTPFAQSKGLRLELRAPQLLPPVHTDPAKLDKVVTNLLSNACKFTNAGGTVAVRLSQEEESLTIAVWDTGVGISEQDLPRIFERFQQVDGSATRKYEGTGIGLALSKELMELVGGSLEVKSEEGVGSTFTAILPLGKQHIPHPEMVTDDRSLEDSRDTAQGSIAATAAATAAALAAEIGLAEAMVTEGETERDQETLGAETTEEDTGGRPEVVVVEDNPAMRALVTEICSSEFMVQQAEDGLQGLELIRTRRPALVISDVMMPQMDGYEMLRELRASAETATIPVLLLTARAGADLRLEGLEQGADDYLTKPFQPRELRARARNLVRLQQQEHRLQELNERLQQEVVRQATELERSRVLRKFLPADVAESVLSQQDAIEAQLQQKRLNLTVFQLELRGFGELVEQQEPELLAVMLNSYLSEMMEVAFGHGATVDCFDRDRVTGFFGAPRSEGMQQDALRGVQLALELRDRARAICDRWRELLDAPPPKPTVGLATGYATVGYFGSSRRLDYTAVGGPVEDATAMLTRVAPGGVWCSHETWKLIQEEFHGHLDGEVPLAHRPQPIRLYRLYPRRDQP